MPAVTPDLALPADWRLDLSDAELRAIAAALDGDVDRGLRREPGAALATLPAYVGVPRAAARGRVLCLDAGGTNVRAALVTVTSDEVAVGQVRHAPLPGTRTPVDRPTFFAGLAALLAPDVARVRRIAFCFSYPAEVFPDGDAVLLRWTKEVQAQGVEGARVGQGLVEGLVALGHPGDYRVVVLNDTVTTLLAATRDPQTRGCAAFVGVVVGTGTNMAAFEPAAAVKGAAPSWTGGPLAVNLESGNFGTFPRGVLDERLAQATHDPARQWLEKAVSGQYLGALFHLAMRDWASRGGLPATLAEAAHTQPPPPAAALSRLLAAAPAESPWERLFRDDPAARPVGLAVARSLAGRSARLVAAGLAALVERAARAGGPAPDRRAGRAGHAPAAPVAIAAEGSLFWGVPGYREIVVDTIARLTSHPVRVVRIPDANLKGAALAALTRTGTRRSSG
jgi:hexokinase